MQSSKSECTSKGIHNIPAEPGELGTALPARKAGFFVGHFTLVDLAQAFRDFLAPVNFSKHGRRASSSGGTRGRRWRQRRWRRWRRRRRRSTRTRSRRGVYSRPQPHPSQVHQRRLIGTLEADAPLGSTTVQSCGILPHTCASPL